MPGFMVFEQFGEDELDMSDPDNQMHDLGRFPKRFNPVQFIQHGLFGEYNVDLDPAELLRQVLDGQVPEPWAYVEAYYGWLSVVNVQQTIAGLSSDDSRKDKARNAEQQRMRNNPGRGGTPGGNGEDESESGSSKSKDNLIKVEVELDVSLPYLIKAALEPEPPNTEGASSRIFKHAQIHMCTTAQIDTSLLSPGQGNPGSFLLSFLGSTLRFNIIPFLTITMQSVQIDEVDFTVQGDSGANTPTVGLELSYEEITYTYHVINTSNMSLYHVDYHYSVSGRNSPEEKMFHLSNPFL